ncbi:zinc-dependent alcohol dehydrogenase [Solwaraspora sp. WMMB335]|uniref:zinc-dependent alcohol dehydrogenase n=1 Tax=Solwaraspora sp. WMMB335 TaxID=3404118 RepID=UPI003B9477BF
MTRRDCLAAVKVAASRTELREIALPAVEDSGGLLRIEASGVCGADVGWYADVGLPNPGPVILGHHIVGSVDEIAEATAARLGVAPGDRLLIEEYLPCGGCAACAAGTARLCPACGPTGDTLRYGSTPIGVGTGLWGGYSQYLWLDDRAMVHRLPPDLPTELATLVFPLANAISWVRAAGVGPGDTLVVVGPGKLGLSCLAAARAVDAGFVAMLGRPGDETRLALAAELGADHVTTEAADLRRAVAAGTAGRMAQAVVDTAAGTAATIDFAVDVLGFDATIALAQWPAGHTGVDLPALAAKRATITTVRGRDDASIRSAVDLVSRDPARFAPMCSGTVELADLHDTLTALRYPAGRGDLIHVSAKG